MGALSEESAITVSSLSTDLWNNWTKNNAEGISFLFCSSLLVCDLKKKPNQHPPLKQPKIQTNPKQTKNPTKSIMMIAATMLLSLGHC